MKLSIKESHVAEQLDQLQSSKYPQAQIFIKVLNQISHKELKLDSDESHGVDKIEQERNRLLNIHDLLVDGSLEKITNADHTDITVAKACEASKSPKLALLLYLLTKAFNPKLILEMGTNLGISAAYLKIASMANAENAKIITLDGSLYRLRIAKEVHKNLGFDNIEYVGGSFGQRVDEVLDKIDTLDFAFIDGNHHKKPTLEYFEKILTKTRENSLILFDDIRWSAGMTDAWHEIQKHPKVKVSCDFQSIGACIV